MGFKHIKYIILLCLGASRLLSFTPENHKREMERISNNSSFKLFKLGNNKEIYESEGVGHIPPGKLYGHSKMDPIENFGHNLNVRKGNLRSILRSYFRFLYNNEHSTTETGNFVELEQKAERIPVLHFIDGENNHYMLKRINDETFDLVLLTYSKEYDHHSLKRIENYPLEQFVEIARLSNTKEIRIALYKEGSFEIPLTTNHEIPLTRLRISNLFAEKKEQEAIQKRKLALKTPINKRIAIRNLTDKRMVQLKNRLSNMKRAELNQLTKRKQLVKMRLPYLDLTNAWSMKEISVIVQSEIIRQIFDPDPAVENCPGKINSKGQCVPDGNWDEKTWKLYRRLYKIVDVAGAVFYEN
jgi:hypothetical protein